MAPVASDIRVLLASAPCHGSNPIRRRHSSIFPRPVNPLLYPIPVCTHRVPKARLTSDRQAFRTSRCSARRNKCRGRVLVRDVVKYDVGHVVVLPWKLPLEPCQCLWNFPLVVELLLTQILRDVRIRTSGNVSPGLMPYEEVEAK